MPQLYLLRASYDLFVYDFRYDFSGIVGVSKLRRMYILYDHPAISFRDRPGQPLQRPCRNRTEAAQSSCSHRVIFTTSAQKLYYTRAMSLRVP